MPAAAPVSETETPTLSGSELTEQSAPAIQAEVSETVVSDVATKLADLDAQQAMAEAAWWMVGLAGVQLAFAMASMFLLFFTFRQTQRASEASEKMVGESRQAALATSAAANAATEANEISRLTQRAWLEVLVEDAVELSPFYLDQTPQQPPISEGDSKILISLPIRIKNHGNMPCTDISISCSAYWKDTREHMIAFEIDESPTLGELGSFEYLGKTLFPGAEASHHRQSIEPIRGKNEHEWARITVIGKVTYKTNGKVGVSLFGFDIMTEKPIDDLSKRISDYGAMNPVHFWERAAD